MTPSEGAGIIRYARECGVNFFDTAHIYGTYEHLRHAIGPHETGVVIASRSYAYDADTMREHLELALRQTGRERIEVFGLHEQESRLTLVGHREALEYLGRAKEQGKVGAVVVSTHYVDVARALAVMPEVDVVHALINMSGIGIRDGTAEDMAEALATLNRRGKGVYAMKALGGGHLSSQNTQALAFVRDISAIDAVAVGMASSDEVLFNVAMFSGLEPPPGLEDELRSVRRRLVIEDWCNGCGDCARACPARALSVLGGRATVDDKACVFCGYCAQVCVGFCIKVLSVR
jgi:aryl-alcohol dehydrogenase-like predicted oxidoreductase/NAD-dependent dihydropyrimidine dehydrogenase PreA subunit